MNTYLRLSTLLVVTTLGVSTGILADTHTAGQTLDVNIEPVLLLAIGNPPGGSTSINIPAPTQAGATFDNVTPTVNNDTFPIAISSNISTASLYAKAEVDGQPLSGYRLQLSVDPSGPGSFNQPSRNLLINSITDKKIADVRNLVSRPV